ncbi:GNAT family N-acetyltransferase [uncultured Desulfosarcina sp.]|uniref:GNAT family N-acetyltransferase n=1 Tax=uncultured Desulfosarcina sp. TaxID=218289 RepID=UPI0029C725D5|nr:GNAT family N-acetyltransferase [uncultured Desulfosarcina sp.]
MTDLLVKLYDLPDHEELTATLARLDTTVRRAMASEMKQVVGWIQQVFGDGWAAECEVSFGRQPIACMVAVSAGRVAGFACHDSTCRNFFGPIGVDPTCRRKGVGTALLLATLQSMAQAGYAYAIIGGVGPMAFFEKSVGAFPIPGSTPGIYHSAIKKI